MKPIPCFVTGNQCACSYGPCAYQAGETQSHTGDTPTGVFPCISTDGAAESGCRQSPYRSSGMRKASTVLYTRVLCPSKLLAHQLGEEKTNKRWPNTDKCQGKKVNLALKIMNLPLSYIFFQPISPPSQPGQKIHFLKINGISLLPYGATQKWLPLREKV